MSDRPGWELRHREARLPPQPSAFLERVAGELPRGLCLDIASGRGGNALFLARHGFQVEAIDWSFEAARALRTADNAIRVVVADLRSFPLPVARYQVVLCFRYLDRTLWPSMVRALKPSGALVFETMTKDILKRNPGFSPEFCLEAAELARPLPGLRVERYQESAERGLASLLAYREDLEETTGRS